MKACNLYQDYVFQSSTFTSWIKSFKGIESHLGHQDNERAQIRLLKLWSLQAEKGYCQYLFYGRRKRKNGPKQAEPTNVQGNHRPENGFGPISISVTWPHLIGLKSSRTNHCWIKELDLAEMILLLFVQINMTTFLDKSSG